MRHRTGTIASRMDGNDENVTNPDTGNTNARDVSTLPPKCNPDMDSHEIIMESLHAIERRLETLERTEPDQFIEEVELEQLLHISHRSMVRYRNAGKLRFKKLGRRVLYNMADVRPIQTEIEKNGHVQFQCALLRSSFSRTRQEVVAFIHRGTTSVRELARILGINQVCMERLIEIMVQDGEVTRSEDGVIRARTPKEKKHE